MQFLYGQASLQYVYTIEYVTDSKALVTVCGRGWNKNANNGAANGAGEERQGRSRSECHGSTQHEV